VGWRSRLGMWVGGMAGAGALLASPAAAGTTGSITVTPDTGLQDGQVVSAELVGPPDASLLVMQCRNPIGNVFEDCSGASGVSTSTGTYTMAFAVQRTFLSQTLTDVECDAAHPCALTLWVFPSGSSYPTLADTAPISFSK
jgi:hypothetical protein